MTPREWSGRRGLSAALALGCAGRNLDGSLNPVGSWVGGGVGGGWRTNAGSQGSIGTHSPSVVVALVSTRVGAWTVVARTFAVGFVVTGHCRHLRIGGSHLDLTVGLGIRPLARGTLGACSYSSS